MIKLTMYDYNTDNYVMYCNVTNLEGLLVCDKCIDNIK